MLRYFLFASYFWSSIGPHLIIISGPVLLMVDSLVLYSKCQTKGSKHAIYRFLFVKKCFGFNGLISNPIILYEICSVRYAIVSVILLYYTLFNEAVATVYKKWSRQ